MDEKSGEQVVIEGDVNTTSIEVDEPEIEVKEPKSGEDNTKWEQLDVKLQRLVELQEKLLLNLTSQQTNQPSQPEKQPEMKQPEQPSQSEQVKVTLADNPSKEGEADHVKTKVKKPRKRSLSRNRK